MRNHRTSAFNDVRGRAVIAFELDNRHRSKIAVEVADNLDVCATPAVNTLVVIAHHRYVFRIPVDEQLQKFILDVIRILVFVHDNVLETFSQLFRQIRDHLQHANRIEQQVVEIHRVRFRKFFLISRVIAGLTFFVSKFSVQSRHIRRLQDSLVVLVQDRILETGNRAMDLFQFIHVVIVAKIVLQDFLEDAFLVVVIVNGKVCIKPLAAKCLDDRFLRQTELQKLKANGVERAHPRERLAAIQKLLDTVLHFAGSLVRKGHRKHAIGVNPVVRNQVSNLVSNAARLSRTCTGQNQHRAVDFLRGSGLFRVQLFI